MVVEALSWWSQRASQHPAVRSPVHPRKIPTNLACSPLLVGPRGKKVDRGQRSAFFPLRNLPVHALYFGLATWVHPSRPASPRSFSVPGANLVLIHRLLFSSLQLFAAIRQFWCHDRWYERSGLWIQLAVHRQRHQICRKLVTARLDSLPSPHFHGLGPPRPGGNQGRAHYSTVHLKLLLMCLTQCVQQSRLQN